MTTVSTADIMTNAETFLANQITVNDPKGLFIYSSFAYLLPNIYEIPTVDATISSLDFFKAFINPPAGFPYLSVYELLEGQPIQINGITNYNIISTFFATYFVTGFVRCFL